MHGHVSGVSVKKETRCKENGSDEGWKDSTAGKLVSREWTSKQTSEWTRKQRRERTRKQTSYQTNKSTSE